MSAQSRRLCSRSAIAFEPSSSLGLDGTAPAGSTSSDFSPHGCTTSPTRTSPSSTSVSPAAGSSPSCPATPGARRSASTSSTRQPASASAMARLQERLVRPSPAPGLQTVMTRAGSATLTKRRLVRSLRIASPRGDRPARPAIRGAERAAGSYGISPSTGAPVTRRRVRASRIRVSVTPRSSARSSPASRPASAARQMSRTGRGATGAVPAAGPSTTSMALAVGRPAPDSTSPIRPGSRAAITSATRSTCSGRGPATTTRNIIAAGSARTRNCSRSADTGVSPPMSRATWRRARSLVTSPA